MQDRSLNLTTASNTSSKELGAIHNINGNFSITKCNYLNNKYNGTQNAIIVCSTSTSYSITYSSCSFIENKGNYLFDRKPTIDNCYFNNTERFEPNDPLDSYIYIIIHQMIVCFQMILILKNNQIQKESSHLRIQNLDI